MNNLVNTIKNFIEQNKLIPTDSTIIIGLSGGPDSVFLLHVLVLLGKSKNVKLIGAHLDHEWRADSSKDVEFCKDLCQQLNIPFINRKISELQLPFSMNGSKEDFGRKARRFFFELVAKEYHANTIALGHHADDQMETFFIRLIRGASLSGLAGMKPQEKLYIRPLLIIKKDEILEYLKQNNIPFLVDPTNVSPDFLRNRIRNNVIPALRECDKRFDHNFASTHENLQQTEDFLQELAAQKLAEISDANNAIDINALLALHPVLRNRIIIIWLIAHKVSFIPSQGLLEEIIRFLSQPGNATHTLYGKWRICKSKGKVFIQNSQ